MDIFEAIKLKKWDLGIFFPPCTYLSYVGNAWFNVEKYGQKAIDRYFKRHDAFEFFLRLYFADIPHIAIENPMGYINSAFRPPDQIIEPYYFGDNHRKRTCLWLKNLPKLVHVKTETMFESATHIAKPEPIYTYLRNGKPRKLYFSDAISGNSKDGAKKRSKTFPGIAKAIANQWSEYLENGVKKC